MSPAAGEFDTKHSSEVEQEPGRHLGFGLDELGQRFVSKSQYAYVGGGGEDIGGPPALEHEGDFTEHRTPG